MLKSIARTFVKSIPHNKNLFLVLKKMGLPDNVTAHMNFKNTEYQVKVGKGYVTFFSNGLVQDNRLFWRGIQSGENFTIQLWQYLSKNSKVILDVGANLGVFALVAKSINPHAEIHGFEPIPATFKMFKKNVDVNSYNVKCHELALSNANDTAQMFMDGENNLTPSLIKKVNGIPIEIKMRTLDSLIPEENIGMIDLLKIDVETFEPEVLEGMKEIVETNRPTMIIEVLNNEVGARVQKLLEGKEYLFFYIDEEKGLIPSEKIIRYHRSRNYFICQEHVAASVPKNFFKTEM